MNWEDKNYYKNNGMCEAHYDITDIIDTIENFKNLLNELYINKRIFEIIVNKNHLFIKESDKNEVVYDFTMIEYKSEMLDVVRVGAKIGNDEEIYSPSKLHDEFVNRVFNDRV